MTKLNDIQRILLSSAAQRDGGSVLPLAKSLTASDRVAKATFALVALGLVEERETTDAGAINRTDGDLRLGLFITTAGLAAIDAGPDADEVIEPEPVTLPARTSKSAAVIALLQRSDGATVAELIEATDWLPHTTRAALTGLRHKGHAIERFKRVDTTCYRILAA